jgi:hypothetical protein
MHVHMSGGGEYSGVSGTFANGARVTAQLTLAVHHIAVAQGRTTTVHTLRSNASDFKPAATAEVMPNIQVVFEALELYARALVARGYATARDMAAFVHAIREFVRLDLSTLPEASQISAVSDIIPALQQLIANKQAHFGAPASYQPILARVARRAHESALTERLRAASTAFGNTENGDHGGKRGGGGKGGGGRSGRGRNGGRGNGRYQPYQQQHQQHQHNQQQQQQQQQQQPQQPQCRDYLRGNCARPNCRFAH